MEGPNSKNKNKNIKGGGSPQVTSTFPQNKNKFLLSNFFNKLLKIRPI